MHVYLETSYDKDIIFNVTSLLNLKNNMDEIIEHVNVIN